MARGSFADRLADLNQQLSIYLSAERSEGYRLQYVKVFLSDAQNQHEALEASSLYRDTLAHSAVTTVEQAPLDGSKVTLLVKTSREEPAFIFQSLRLTNEEANGDSSYLQTMQLFQKYLASLEGTDMTMARNLLRTWIYVADIDVNYSGVVKARNDVFRSYGLTAQTHFVASTGIGGYSSTRHATVAMDFLTYPGIREEDKKYLTAPDHLNPTAEYGVAFERGTRLTLPSGLQRFFISGTASINDRGEVLYPGDVLRQEDRLLENIGALLADGGATLEDVKYFIVYLRDLSDYAVVEAHLQALWPTVPHVVVLAKVCRPGWLIEMECIAERNH